MTSTSVVLFDVEAKVPVNEMSTNGVRQAIWSHDMSMVALLSKHSKFIYIHIYGDIHDHLLLLSQEYVYFTPDKPRLFFSHSFLFPLFFWNLTSLH